MKKVKLEKDSEGQEVIKSTIEHFYNYVPKDKDGNPKSSGTPMVRIKGNFYKGGFNLSKNKVKAVLDNLELMKQFANGDLDKQIEELKEDEVIQPD